jgi:hypothetical protein
MATIRHSYVRDVFTTDLEAFIGNLIPIAMKDGKPTEKYKEFLLDMAEYAPWASAERRQRMIDVLMCCEEGVYGLINGIIPIEKTDPRYASYATTMSAIHSRAVDSLHISNTSVVHMIQELQRGCTHIKCYRINALHKRWMHSTSSTQDVSD